MGIDQGNRPLLYPSMAPQLSLGCESGHSIVDDSAPFITCLISRDLGTTATSSSKVTIEWIFAVAILSLIFLSCVFRYYLLRRQQRTLTDFFVFMVPARPSARSDLVPTSLPLAPFPPNARSWHANRTDMGVNAADTDIGGRRAGQGDPDDGDLNDKDLLPSYEKQGAPPRYPDLGSGGGDPRPVDPENLTQPVPAHDIQSQEGISPNPPSYMDTGVPPVSNVSHSAS